MRIIEFNLNNNIIVKLDKHGEKILKNYYSTDNIDALRSKEKEGYYLFHFWEFIHIFGEYSFSCSNLPFSCNAYIYIE